jgi:CDP-glycerol glycerophosphotransferase (TagB/SpsB family)
MSYRILLFGAFSYALPILRPLQQAARARGWKVAWFFDGIAPPRAVGEHWLDCVAAAVQFAPDAVLSAANDVPYFLTGIKAQVFHGFSVNKRSANRGHFRLRGFFDLYCTQGPDTTAVFQKLAEQHRYFRVCETGWPKMDPVFRPDVNDHTNLALRLRAAGRPIILFGSTFTESLSAAPHLYDAISALLASGRYFFLLTLHPKISPHQQQRYRALEGEHAAFIESEELPQRIGLANLLIADTTSLVPECAVAGKPVVCFRNRQPEPYMIQIDAPDQLNDAIERGLAGDATTQAHLQALASRIHPTRDGRASERILDAVIAMDRSDLAAKPLNLWRKLQQRWHYGFWWSWPNTF